MPQSKTFKVVLEGQHACGKWTDIRVYSEKMILQTVDLEFICIFCNTEQLQQLRNQLELIERERERKRSDCKKAREGNG